MEKLREDGPDGFGRPARVDDLRERYRAALEEEGTDGPDHDGTVTGPESDGSGLPHGAPGQIAAPSAPGGSAGSSRSVTAQPNAAMCGAVRVHRAPSPRPRSPQPTRP